MKLKSNLIMTLGISALIVQGFCYALSSPSRPSVTYFYADAARTISIGSLSISCTGPARLLGQTSAYKITVVDIPCGENNPSSEMINSSGDGDRDGGVVKAKGNK